MSPALTSRQQQQQQQQRGGVAAYSNRQQQQYSNKQQASPSYNSSSNNKTSIVTKTQQPTPKLLPILQQASLSTDASGGGKPSSSSLPKTTNSALLEPKVIKFSNLVNLASIKNPEESSTDQRSDKNGIHKHSSLDGKEKQIALTIREKKELKQFEHEKYMEKLKEYSEDIKHTRKGEAFDVESNRYISRKNELQKEMDQLTFEMKKFVYDQTIKPKNTSINGNMVSNQELSEKQKFKIKQMMKEEYRQQGKDISSMIEKSKYVNYKQFKQEKKQEKKMERIETREMIKNGVLDKKQLRKRRLMDQQRKSSQTRKFYAKYGAPNEVGVAAVKSKYGKGGAVGKWKGGMLHIRREDLDKLK